MASCAQAIVRDTPTFTHNTPSRRASSSGGNLLRRMTINILEDMTSPVTSNGSATAAGTGGAHSGSGSGREHTFVEVAKWLHLQDNVLITRDIQKSKRKKTNTDHNNHNADKNEQHSHRIFIHQILEVLDYGDFDDPVPFSIKGCITIITLDLKKHFFHFGDDIKTKSAWLIAFDAAMDHYLFQKSLYSSPPHVELPSTLQFKMKKKFDKLFSLYRSIRDEDAILVFNECLLPTAEGTSSPSSLSATAGTVTAGKSSGLSPMDVTHYIQYEFYRRKDIKLQLHLQELAQYFIKNYPPKLLELMPTKTRPTPWPLRTLVILCRRHLHCPPCLLKNMLLDHSVTTLL